MGLFINTNINALRSAGRLRRQQGGLDRVFERLSGGQRINAARDDAAGLAISNRMEVRVRGLNRAALNAQDGISLAQTLDGALEESTSMLQRIRELAVQAANDTNTASDRESLDDEVQQLIAELGRVASSTRFNDTKLLDGSFTTRSFQIGAGAREALSVTVADARPQSLGRGAIATSEQVVASLPFAGQSAVYVNGSTITWRAAEASDDAVSTTFAMGSALAKASAINDSTQFTGVSARATAARYGAPSAIGGGTLDASNTLTINGQTLSGIVITAGDAGGVLLQAINERSAQTGVAAKRNAAGRLELVASDGRNIEVIATGAAGAITGFATGVRGGGLELTGTQSFRLTGQQGRQGFATPFDVSFSRSSSMATAEVRSRDSANRTLDIVDRALEQISAARSLMGATQNRLEKTINNLTQISAQMTSARSRIVDADFAAETSNLSRRQIISQSATSILAQANQQPQQVLSLLAA